MRRLTVTWRKLNGANPSKALTIEMRYHFRVFNNIPSSMKNKMKAQTTSPFGKEFICEGKRVTLWVEESNRWKWIKNQVSKVWRWNKVEVSLSVRWNFWICRNRVDGCWAVMMQRPVSSACNWPWIFFRTQRHSVIVDYGFVCGDGRRHRELPILSTRWLTIQ